MKPITPLLLVLAAASCAVSLASCGKPSGATSDAGSTAPAPVAPAPDSQPAEPARDTSPPPPPNGEAICPMIREAFLDLLKPGSAATPSAEACEIGVSGHGFVRVTIAATGSDEPPPSAGGDPIRRPAPEFGTKAQLAATDAGKASSRLVIYASAAGGHLATIEVEPGKPIDDAMLARIKVDASAFLDAVTLAVVK